jgi:hypothetical protein
MLVTVVSTTGILSTALAVDGALAFTCGLITSLKKLIPYAKLLRRSCGTYLSAMQIGRVNNAQIGMNVGITPEAMNAISFFIVITFSSYKTQRRIKRFTRDVEGR